MSLRPFCLLRRDLRRWVRNIVLSWALGREVNWQRELDGLAAILRVFLRRLRPTPKQNLDLSSARSRLLLRRKMRQFRREQRKRYRP